MTHPGREATRYCLGPQGMTPAQDTPCPEWDREEQWVKAADYDVLQARVRELEQAEKIQATLVEKATSNLREENIKVKQLKRQAAEASEEYCLIMEQLSLAGIPEEELGGRNPDGQDLVEISTPQRVKLLRNKLTEAERQRDALIVAQTRAVGALVEAGDVDTDDCERGIRQLQTARERAERVVKAARELVEYTSIDSAYLKRIRKAIVDWEDGKEK